jgi:NCS1 family nucleobase:cation symporter-1
LIGILIMPWKLYTDLSQYIFTWLIGYSALLGAVAGVMLADYYLLRRARLDTEALYLEDGEYAFGGSGFNWRALAAVALGIAINVPGFLAQASGGSIQVAAIFESLYTYAWFVSLLIAGIAHLILSTAFPPPAAKAAGSDEQGASR